MITTISSNIECLHPRAVNNLLRRCRCNRISQVCFPFLLISLLIYNLSLRDILVNEFSCDSTLSLVINQVCTKVINLQDVSASCCRSISQDVLAILSHVSTVSNLEVEYALTKEVNTIPSRNIVVDNQNVSEVKLTALICVVTLSSSCINSIIIGWNDVLELVETITITECRSLCWHYLLEWSCNCTYFCCSTSNLLLQSCRNSICVIIDELVRLSQYELNELNILVQLRNFCTICLKVLNSEICWLLLSLILSSNSPFVFSCIEIVLAEINSYLRWNELWLIFTCCSLVEWNGSCRDSHINLSITYCYIECTSIRVCQCTIVVNSVNTETDYIALNITQILDLNSTLVTSEQLSWLVCCTVLLVTNVLIRVWVPSIKLRRSRLKSELLIESYIEALYTEVLVCCIFCLCEVDNDIATLLYSQDILVMTVILSLITACSICLIALSNYSSRRLFLILPNQFLNTCCWCTIFTLSITVVDVVDWSIVYCEVVSVISHICTQCYTILRSNATILCLISCVGILNSNRVENVLFSFIYLSHSSSLECIAKILSLELNYPKTCIYLSSTSKQSIISVSISNLDKVIKLQTLRVQKWNIACCQLCINRRNTNQQAILTYEVLTLLELELSVSNAFTWEYISLLCSLNKVQVLIETCFSCCKIVELNVSYHCRVLTDDVLQLVLDVVNLKLEISELIAILITLQCSFNNRQTSVKTCKTCILCCQLTIDSLDSCSYCILLIETCTKSLECVLDSSLVSNSLSQSVVSSTLSSFNIWLQCIVIQSLKNLSLCICCILYCLVSSTLSSFNQSLQVFDILFLESLDCSIYNLISLLGNALVGCITCQDVLNLIKSSLAVSSSLNLSQLCFKGADASLVRRNQSLELFNLLLKLIGSSKLVDLTLQVADVVIIILTRSKCTHGCHCKCSHKQRA